MCQQLTTFLSLFKCPAQSFCHIFIFKTNYTLGNEAQNPHKQAFILTQRTTKIQFNNKTHTIIHLYGII
ncbi:hypothetical protein BGC33_06340 [Bathymodiolus thermophilus thioautotrophic gill symbiont]|uniref:Uncharacterized protein n=1 Tax=Bathymodiolus thermophilus thioautotrophic gill symbiont TaxID=2360 RepID=A0A1J5UAJ2_9GAMM|nr:hypothetical protein BGC33_06340 [Bathymodiolus thermophilus thioautotrophic gill symbiont]